MSYCRWGEGDVYAYAATNAYVAHVASSAEGIDDTYEEKTAADLYERMLWLRSKNIDFPDQALAWIREDALKEAREVFPEADPWQAQVLTLYPEMFPGILSHSLSGRAQLRAIWSLDTVQIRDFAEDKHRSVDDTPAGGGAGMVLRADVLGRAVDHARAMQPDAPLLYMSPRGTPLTQARVRDLATGPGVTILCGRFEGVDQRLLDARDIEEVSIGDYILSGGEVAAMVLLDACIRLIPGVMGAALSGEDESFENGLLEYPHYTRPQEWEGRTIPEVLRSGDHARIAAWRQDAARELTRLRRPDLWERHEDARVHPPSGVRREKKDE